MNTLNQNYSSPRWNGELCDCSMPLTFDTYNACSYNCLYCFAYFQKSHTVKGYKDVSSVKNRTVRSVNPKKVISLFNNILSNNAKSRLEKQFNPYIKNRITMQWGGFIRSL